MLYQPAACAPKVKYEFGDRDGVETKAIIAAITLLIIGLFSVLVVCFGALIIGVNQLNHPKFVPVQSHHRPIAHNVYSDWTINATDRETVEYRVE